MTRPAPSGSDRPPPADGPDDFQFPLFLCAVIFLFVAVAMWIENHLAYGACSFILALCCTVGITVPFPSLRRLLYLSGEAEDQSREPDSLTPVRDAPPPTLPLPSERESSGYGGPGASSPPPADDQPRPWQERQPEPSGEQDYYRYHTTISSSYPGSLEEQYGTPAPLESPSFRTAEPPAMPQAPVPGPPSQPPAPPAGREEPTEPAPDPAPAFPYQIGRMAEPIVFHGSSAAGQAPWHLPKGNGVQSPGLTADGIRLGGLEVRAATMVGAGHRCAPGSDPRQDAYSLAQTDNGEYLLAAVADGVSNSEHSDLGARIAASRATRSLAALIDRSGRCPEDTAQLATAIARDMAATAKGRKIPESEVQCVLAAVAIPARPDPDGRRHIWVYWIGDSSAWLCHDGKLRRITGEPKEGPDPNALSATLPFQPQDMKVISGPVDPGDSVILMTDGLSDSLEQIGGTQEYFASQWSERPPHPAAFLYSLCYDAPGQTDDRTAVVTWCGAPGQGQRGRQ